MIHAEWKQTSSATELHSVRARRVASGNSQWACSARWRRPEGSEGRGDCSRQEQVDSKAAGTCGHRSEYAGVAAHAAQSALSTGVTSNDLPETVFFSQHLSHSQCRCMSSRWSTMHRSSKIYLVDGFAVRFRGSHYLAIIRLAGTVMLVVWLWWRGLPLHGRSRGRAEAWSPSGDIVGAKVGES